MDQMLDALTRGLPLDDSDQRLRRRKPRRDGQLSGAIAGAGTGAAVELARRAHAVAAGDSDADRAGAQAGPARAVDALSHGGRVRRSGHSGRGDFDLSRRRRRGRGGAGQLPAEHDFRRRGHGRALQGQSARAGARPGFSKILLGDDVVDQWEEYIDLMVDSVYLNSGRGCINCSGIWASRHTDEIAAGAGRADRARSKSSRPKIRKPAWRRSRCRAWRRPFGNRSRPICAKPGVEHMTGPLRPAAGRDGALRAICGRRSSIAIRRKRRSPRRNTCFRSSRWSSARRSKMIESIGPTLVCTAITDDPTFQQPLDRRHAHRPLEHRADSDDQARLAATARREHRRVLVSGPRYQIPPERLAKLKQ